MLDIKKTLRAGVPLVVVETSDPAQSEVNILAQLNGKAKDNPVMRHDLARGLVPLNEAAREYATEVYSGEDIATLKVTEMLIGWCAYAERDRANLRTFLLMVNPQMSWGRPDGGAFIVQAIWNLRDTLKRSASQLYLLVPRGTQLPVELRGDVVVLIDSLPDRNEIKEIVRGVTQPYLSEAQVGDLERVVDTVTGIPAFGIEQVVSMSVTKAGLNLDELWTRKRQTIEQTRGLKVWRGGETFEQVQGYPFIVNEMRTLQKADDAPLCYVLIDEFEKSIGNVQGDNTNVSQDQLKSLLTFMEDYEVTGSIFIGIGGSGKSAIAKAAGNDAGVPTIAMDLGSLKESALGASETNIRKALDVIYSVSQGRMYFIATCNSIGLIPTEMKRRFTDGIYYFPLPDDAARESIWPVYFKKYGLPAQDRPDDRGWTGAEIRNCARRAKRRKVTLIEAARAIVPVSVSDREVLERLQSAAHNRYLDAARGGAYRNPAIVDAPALVSPTSNKRQLEVE
jgi:hypothetical protein